jgi:hypothetical protein
LLLGDRQVGQKPMLCPVDLGELSIPSLARAGSITEWYQSQLTVQQLVPTRELMDHAPDL